MTACSVSLRDEIYTTSLKFNEESNERSLVRRTQVDDIVSGPFPVLEGTYAKIFSKFQLSVENYVDPNSYFLNKTTLLKNSFF